MKDDHLRSVPEEHDKNMTDKILDYNPASLSTWLRKQNDKLTTISHRCKSWDEKMKNHIKSPDTVRELNRNINVALVAVLIEDLDYPVKVVPLHLLQGPPICDNITYDNGVYRKVEPEENEQEFNNRFEQLEQSH